MNAPSFALLFTAACAVIAGCSSEDTKSPPSSGGFASAAVTTGASSGSGSTSGAGGAGGGTTSATTTGSGAGPGRCAKGCSMDSECCPELATNCPGPAPKDNYSCGDGICIVAHCVSDDNCMFGTCHEIDGLGTCFNVCAVDDDCAIVPSATCSGAADDGAKYCNLPSPECATDEDCAGLGTCNELARCECQLDSECTAPGVDTCAK